MANKKLNAIITIGGTVSSTLRRAFSTTGKQVDKFKTQIGDLTRRQTTLSRAIQTFGRQGKNVDTLREKYKRIGQQIDQVRRQQERLNRSVARRAAVRGAGDRIAGASAPLAAGGLMAGVAARATLGESKEWSRETARIQALGLGHEATDEAVRFATTLKTFGTSQLENLTLMRDAMSIFADAHHAEMATPVLARMKFANTAMFGKEKGEENEKQFFDMLKVIELRNGATSQAEFNKQANYIQQVISATGGRVAGSEWRDVISTGGLAAKSMDNEKFYYQLEPLIQEMGGFKVGTALMSGYSGLYQGRTTKRAARNLEQLGLIGDPSKVKHDKAGQVSYLNPGALLGADVFRSSQFDWVNKVLVPQLAKKGITSDDKILDVIGSIVSNRTAANLLSTMYLQRNLIEKSSRVNASAANIDQLDAQARDTAQGREMELRAKQKNAELKLGNALLPIYVKFLTKAADVMERFNKWAEKNPESTAKLGLAIGGLAVGMTALSAASFIVGRSLYTVYKVGQFAWRGISLLGSGMRYLATRAVPLVINVIRSLGVAAVSNPIGATIAAIVVAVTAASIAIYKHWQGIKAFFSGLWSGLTEGLEPLTSKFGFLSDLLGGPLRAAFGWVSDSLSTAWDWFTKLLEPVNYSSTELKKAGEAGRSFGTALAAGIDFVTKPLQWLIDSIKFVTTHMDDLTEQARNFKDTVGGAPGRTLSAIKGLFSAPFSGGSSSGGSSPVAPPAPAMAGRGGAGTVIHDSSTTEIHVTQQPGESARAFADRIQAELKRKWEIRQRSMMNDGVSSP